MKNDLKIESGLGLKGKFILTLRDLAGNVVGKQTVGNLVVNASKVIFAKMINGESTFTGAVNYLAVGTGTASPAVTDTTLVTEIGRVIPISQVRAGNEITFEFYFSPSEANGVLKEVGAFIDGAAGVDTGELFDRAMIDITKTSLNSLTIELVITVD
jgi:hypothetical protein